MMTSDSFSPPGTPETRVSAGMLLLVYLGFTLFCLAIVIALFFVLDQFFEGSSGSNSAMGVVVPMVAAMSTAGYWAKRESQASSGRKWGFSFLAALVTLVIKGSIVWYVASSGLVPELAMTGRLSQDDMMFGAALAVGLLVILTLVIRGGIWMGFNGAAKQKLRQEQLAAKKQAGR